MKAVDTSFLVDYLDEDEGVEAYLAEHEDEPFFVPTLAMNEIYRGAVLSEGADTIDDLEDQLDWLDRLPFTDESVREAAEIEGELQAAGEPINQFDLLIAGTVRQVGAPLVTRDGHFDRVDGLDVERYDE